LKKFDVLGFLRKGNFKDFYGVLRKGNFKGLLMESNFLGIYRK
jgi:hypothetical protein